MKQMIRILTIGLIALLAACQPEAEPLPPVVLNGDSEITILYGETFDDPGAYIDGDIDADLTVNGQVNTTREGTYLLTYWYEYEGEIVQVQRRVIVDDPLDVDFYLIGSSTITIQLGDNYTDPGLYISDTSIPVDVQDDVNMEVAGTYTINFTIEVDGYRRTLTRTLIIEDPAE